MHLSSVISLLIFALGPCVRAQESPNQNQSDTLVNKYIDLPLQTLENQTFCKQWKPNGTSQWEWLYEVVYTAFTGEYKPLADPKMYQGQGILNSSAYYRDPIGEVTEVNLLKYFDGSHASASRDGKPTAVKFVYGNGTKWEDGRLKIRWTPVFETVITHMVEYMGVILGCNELSFPLYEGDPSMFKVHRFMDFKATEMHYFIHNLYDSLVNFGVSVDDGVVFGTAIDNLFNKLCSPVRQIATYQPAAAQNVCLDNSTCAPYVLGNATCSIYNLPGVGQPPQNASSVNATWDLYGGDGPNHCNGYGAAGTQSAFRPSSSDSSESQVHWGHDSSGWGGAKSKKHSGSQGSEDWTR